MRKLNEKFEDILRRRREGERGLTLIELLVVMIIIGILAAIAIPIFMNQQKTARDSATTSDVKNAATNIQSGMVKYPDASYIALVTETGTGAGSDKNGDGKVVLSVGDSATLKEDLDVSVSKGTVLEVTAGSGATAGTFTVKGYNASGKSYTTTANALTYDSGAGGLKK